MSNQERQSVTPKSNESVASSVAGRLVSVLLAIAIVVVGMVCLGQSAAFFIQYVWAVKQAKEMPRFPAPGTIQMAASPDPPFSMVVTDQEKKQLADLTKDTSYTRQVITENSVLPVANPVGYIQHAIKTVRQGDLTAPQVDRQLEMLLRSEVHTQAQHSVEALLQELVDAPRGASTMLIAQTAEKWASKDNRLLQQKLRSLRSGAPNASRIQQRGQLISLNLEPLKADSMESPQPIGTAQSQPTLAGPRDRAAKSVAQQQTRQTDSDPKTSQELIDALSDPKQVDAILTELESAKPDDALRQMLQEISEGVLESYEVPVVVPNWYHHLAITWRDDAMLRALLDAMQTARADNLSRDQAQRVSQWAFASGDKRWVPTILAWLSPMHADSSPDRHLRIFQHGSWHMLIAATIDHLIDDDFSPLVKYLEEPSVAGSIVRQILIQRSSWPDPIATQVFQTAVGLGQKESSNQSSMAWLSLTRVNNESRDRLTKMIMSVKDEQLRARIWTRLLPIIHPCRVTPTAQEQITKSYNEGLLWSQLEVLLSSDIESTLETLAEVVSQPGPREHVGDDSLIRETLRRVDSRIAGLLLRGEVGSGGSFLVVAERFGGWATANLLDSDVGNAIAVVPEWSSERRKSAIESIRARLRANGF